MDLKSTWRALSMMLVLALAMAVGGWLEADDADARAQGDRMLAGEWIAVTSTLRQGEGLLYMFHTRREVLLVDACHRGRRAGGRRNSFDGDLQSLAGRHCKWDALLSERLPFPREKRHGMLTPAEVKRLFLATEG
jgi:hypothetical protein